MPDFSGGVSGGAGRAAEEAYAVCDRLTCLTLTRRLCLHLALGLSNFRAEMMGESGPWVSGAASQAKHLAGIVEQVETMRKEKMNFRRLAGCFLPEVDRILLQRIPEILRGVKRDVHEPLKNAPQEESGAEEVIRRLTDVLQPYAVESLACGEEINGFLRAQFGAMVDASLAEGKPEMRELAVVSCDLCEYGRHSRVVVDVLTIEQLRLFDQQIEDLLRKSLAACGEAAQNAVFKDTGDGAVILLASPTLAVSFACEVIAAVDTRNRPVLNPDYCWSFRIGIATGDVCITETRTPSGAVVTKLRTSGIALARAIRLQTAAEPNSIIVGKRTWDGLTPEQQALFGPEEQIPGKPHESPSPGHRWRRP